MWVVLEGASMIGPTVADPFHFIANLSQRWPAILLEVHSYVSNAGIPSHGLSCCIILHFLNGGIPGVILQNGSFHNKSQWCTHTKPLKAETPLRGAGAVRPVCGCQGPQLL